MAMNSSSDLTREAFWELSLSELNDFEWELLCDGCGRCCLKKIIEDDSAEIIWTRVICRYFDHHSSRCTCYPQRTQLVPDCLDVKHMDIKKANWMPDTCAYRLRFESKPLNDWHPLIAGSRDKLDSSGISVLNRVVSEEHVHPEGYHEHVIRWVNS